MAPPNRTRPQLREHGAGPVGSPGLEDEAELRFVRAQQQALELIAAGAPLERTLDYIVGTIEEHAPGMRASVLLIPDGLHLRLGSAPALPSEYVSVLDGLPIGPVAGSCGTAMWRGERVIASDITTDELWEPYPEVVGRATRAGLRACWATPLRASTGAVIGSFAMYYGEPREPTAQELALADRASHLSGIAVEHAFARRQLQRRQAEQATIAAISQQALVNGDVEGLMQALVGGITTVLEGGRAAILERRADGEERMRAASGWPAEEPACAFTPLELEIPGTERPWGVLQVVPPDGEPWGEQEMDFLRALANVLGVALERNLRQAELRHQALHDPLTGLPARALLLSLLGHALEHARREGLSVAVLLVDLDRFKLINDSLGPLAGDAVLGAVAPRLRGLVRDSDTVARFGGDEFVIVAGDLRDELEALNLAERVTRELTRPITVAGSTHVVSASVGVSVAHAGEGEPRGLLRDADAAMYNVKREGGGAFRIFEQGMAGTSFARLRLVGAIRKALDQGEFAVAYQRIVSLVGGETVGAEALLRWNAPAGHGQRIPDVIAAAEDSGLIRPIGAWVLERSLAAMAAWSADGGEPWISVNLSARQVASRVTAPLVARLLDEHGIEPRRLVLEITETALFDETGASLQTIEALHELGVRLALDDFGTGFSSLRHLLRYPIHTLKIDRSFVARLPGDRRARAIVSGVTAMAHELGKVVIAEGVENGAQLDEVRALGCDLVQGYLVGRPGSQSDLLRQSAAPVRSVAEERR